MGAWESRVLMFWVRRKACRDGGWALSLAHVLRQGPRAGGEGRGWQMKAEKHRRLSWEEARVLVNLPS